VQEREELARAEPGMLALVVEGELAPVKGLEGEEQVLEQEKKAQAMMNRRSILRDNMYFPQYNTLPQQRNIRYQWDCK
jgi:hypothetical protein